MVTTWMLSENITYEIFYENQCLARLLCLNLAYLLDHQALFRCPVNTLVVLGARDLGRPHFSVCLARG